MVTLLWVVDEHKVDNDEEWKKSACTTEWVRLNRWVAGLFGRLFKRAKEIYPFFNQNIFTAPTPNTQKNQDRAL